MDNKEPSKVLKIGKNLSKEIRGAISEFLKQNLDVFTWAYSDMEGINLSIMNHYLKVDLSRKQKRWAMDAERYQALKEEVDKLFSCDFIKGSFYPSWLMNPVLVKKPNGKWRTYVDFTNLNKACLKDSFPLSRIDQQVDATLVHTLLSFMDAYWDTTRSQNMSPIKNTLPLSQTAGSTIIRSCHSISRTHERPTNISSL